LCYHIQKKRLENGGSPAKKQLIKRSYFFFFGAAFFGAAFLAAGFLAAAFFTAIVFTTFPSP
jgi:hypothetical protein